MNPINISPVAAFSDAAPSGSPEIFTVEFSGHDGNSFDENGGNAEYLTMYKPGGTSQYVWMQYESANSDPGGGDESVEVSVDGGMSDSDCATSFATTIDALPDWNAVVVGTLVTVTAAANGVRIDAEDSSTGMTITVTQQGS